MARYLPKILHESIDTNSIRTMIKKYQGKTKVNMIVSYEYFEHKTILKDGQDVTAFFEDPGLIKATVSQAISSSGGNPAIDFEYDSTENLVKAMAENFAQDMVDELDFIMSGAE